MIMNRTMLLMTMIIIMFMLLMLIMIMVNGVGMMLATIQMVLVTRTIDQMRPLTRRTIDRT